MKKRRILLALLGILVGWGMAGMAQAAPIPAVTFETTDNPGSYFDCSQIASSSTSLGCVSYGGQKSLAVINPGETIAFQSTGQARTLHTAVSLIWPTLPLTNKTMPFDVDLVPPTRGGDGSPFLVTPTVPGLYVFYCDIHPYMFAAVIVDDPNTKANDNISPSLDLGETIDLINGIKNLPTASDLATRLLRTFFIASDPTNWKDYNVAGTWHINYVDVAPGLEVRITGGASVPLAATLSSLFGNDTTKAPLGEIGGANRLKPAVGEVWVDTQFELKGASPVKAGTATVVSGQTWTPTRKVGLSMDNPHNMWTNQDQTLIYQTEWFDNHLTVFNRTTGALVNRTEVGLAPAHVMTRTNNDQVHVSLNGDNNVVELQPGGVSINRLIRVGKPGKSAHPHAHWMSHDGNMMVTPNPDTDDSTLYDFPSDQVTSRTATGHFPIATGMTPDSSKYYVANFLDSTISVIGITNRGNGIPPKATFIKNINLLANYDPITLGGVPTGPYGALPIQTPVSPDGKYVFSANTLTATVTIIDAVNDKVISMIHCEPGCHGVQFGAKNGGGYYAYVSSKFTNVMLVIDLDLINPSDLNNDAAVVGRILLANDGAPHDQAITGNRGMGGQGVLPIPVVYNGWVQNLPAASSTDWKCLLSPQQRNPIGLPVNSCQ